MSAIGSDSEDGSDHSKSGEPVFRNSSYSVQSGSTTSTVAGTAPLELKLQAQVGDEITFIVNQPDGVEYRVSQGAYRGPEGFTSVGASGGTLTSADGQIVLVVPPAG